MALKMEEWGKILNTFKSGNESWLERIKEKLKGKDLNTYKEWEISGFHIEHKFDVEYNGLERKFSLLCITAASGHLEIVKYLVDEKGAKVDEKNNHGNIPLHGAAYGGHLEVVKYLVDEKGAKVDEKNNYGKTPLHGAAEGGYLEVVKYLVEKDANVNLQDNDGITPLHWAAEKGYLEVVKYLVDGKGAKVDEKNNHGKTPLHWAVFKSHLEVVKYLVDGKGAKVDEKNNYGKTPLHGAAYGGHLEVVKYLVDEKEAKVDEKNNYGDTPEKTANARSKWPAIATSTTLAIAGVVSGIAIAVYLEMLAVGIAVGACCLVAAAIIYYCNRPSNLLEKSSAEAVTNEVHLET